MSDTFIKTLHSVVAGARQVEEFASVLVGAAVEDALLCVARDYGHDYAALLKRYKVEVVSRHASGSLSEKTTCRGTTKGNKKCGKRAQIQGFCLQHASQMAEEATERRKLTAYRASVCTVNATELALQRLMPRDAADAKPLVVGRQTTHEALNML